MNRWLLVPAALAVLVVAAPSSEAAGLFRNRGCKDDSCKPCIVGYKEEERTIHVCEWVPAKKTVKVCEYKREEKSREVTVYERKPYKEEVEIVVCSYEKVKKTGKRMVCKWVESEEEREVTIDKGHWDVKEVEKTVSYSNKRRGLFGKKSCDDDCCTTVVKCQEKVWISKPEKSKQKFKVCKLQKSEESYDYWVCEPRRETKKVMVERCKWEPKKTTEKYWVCTPNWVEKEVECRVAKMVEKKVKVKVPVYGESCATSSGCSK